MCPARFVQAKPVPDEPAIFVVQAGHLDIPALLQPKSQDSVHEPNGGDGLERPSLKCGGGHATSLVTLPDTVELAAQPVVLFWISVLPPKSTRYATIIAHLVAGEELPVKFIVPFGKYIAPSSFAPLLPLMVLLLAAVAALDWIISIFAKSPVVGAVRLSTELPFIDRLPGAVPVKINVTPVPVIVVLPLMLRPVLLR